MISSQRKSNRFQRLIEQFLFKRDFQGGRNQLNFLNTFKRRWTFKHDQYFSDSKQRLP